MTRLRWPTREEVRYVMTRFGFYNPDGTPNDFNCVANTACILLALLLAIHLFGQCLGL